MEFNVWFSGWFLEWFFHFLEPIFSHGPIEEFARTINDSLPVFGKHWSNRIVIFIEDKTVKPKEVSFKFWFYPSKIFSPWVSLEDDDDSCSRVKGGKYKLKKKNKRTWMQTKQSDKHNLESRAKTVNTCNTTFASSLLYCTSHIGVLHTQVAILSNKLSPWVANRVLH